MPKFPTCTALQDQSGWRHCTLVHTFSFRVAIICDNLLMFPTKNIILAYKLYPRSTKMESNELFNISFPDPSVIHFEKEKQNQDMYTWEQALSRVSADLSLTVLFKVSLLNSSMFHFPKEEEEKGGGGGGCPSSSYTRKQAASPFVIKIESGF